VKPFEPVIRFREFADFGIKYNVVLRAQAVSDQFALQHEFIKRLHKRFAEEGIALAVVPWHVKS
jgi:small-conductance mechanosensitive channel